MRELEKLLEKKFETRMEKRRKRNLFTQRPSLIKLPKLKYFTLESSGDPNTEEYNLAVGALYAMSNGVRMAPKKGFTPEGYFEYTVYPLEGFWGLNEAGKEQFKKDQTFNKNDLVCKIMIRQPDFVTDDFAHETIERITKSKPNPNNELIKFETIEEGLNLQALHLRSYDTENQAFKLIDDFCETNGIKRTSPNHNLSDPRKSAPEKNKTVLRFAVTEL